MRRFQLLLAVCIVVSISGCASRGAVGDFLADILWESIFDSDEADWEKEARHAEEAKWKQFWRENPDVNPAMTNAFSD